MNTFPSAPATGSTSAPSPAGSAAGGGAPAMYCVNHPQTETLLRCSRCLDPICLKCAVRAPVGLRCPKCARVGRNPLYVASPRDYVVAALVATPVAVLAGGIVPRLGLWLALFLSGPAGALVAQAVLRVARKHGRAMQVVAAASIIVGVCVGPWAWIALSGRAPMALTLLALVAPLLNPAAILYVVLACGAAIALLR